MLADRMSIRATQRKFFALLALLALLLPLTGWLVVHIQGPQVEREAHMQLTAIARLKAEQIETWLGERHRDGHVLVTSPDFVRQVVKLVAAAASASASASASGPGLVRAERDAMVSRFNQQRQTYDYDSVDLIDVRGGALVSTGRPAALPATLDRMVAQLQQGGLMPLADVAVGATGEARLRWLLPVFDSTGPMRRLLALVMVHSSPQQFLFPVIQTWPTSSPSGETLLVRREGDSAVFMNSLRHRSGTAMNLRLPMADPVLPAAVALKDKQPGVVNGVDYRGVPVMAAYRPVAGTPWRVVAKLDRDEVMAPVRVLAWWVSGVTVLAILAVAVVLALFWRQLRRAQRLEVLAEKAKSDELMSRFFALPFIGIATGDVGGATWGRVNDHFCAITGYSRDALRGRGWIDLVDAPDWQQDVAGFERLMRGEIDHYEAERRIHRGDRAEAFVSLHWRVLPDAGNAEPRCIMMMQDITQRRLAEQKARRQTCLYAALSECNQAIVQCTERGELFNRICQTAVVLGDMRMAWVGLRDLATQRVLPVAAFGAGIDALSNIDVSASPDTVLGRGAVGTAIREDRPVWIQDFLGSPATAPWHAIGERVGWRSVAAIPLHSQGQVVGVFMLVSGELDGFDTQAQQLLVEMAGDVSFALDNFEHEAQRQRAEQLLQRSQTRLELALKGSSDAPWDWDLVEHRLEYSPQGWHMLGFGAHDIPVGPGLWQALVHPQDLPLIDGLQQQVYQTGANVTTQELRLRHKAGHYVPVLARGFVTRDESGWPVRITGTNMDLTAQHQARLVDSLRPFTLDLMASGLDIDQVVQRLLQRLEELLPERLTAVWLLDAQTGVVEPGPCAALAPMLAQARDGGGSAGLTQDAGAEIVFDPPHAHAPLPHDCALRAALQALACKRDWVQRRCWPVLSSRAQVLGVLDLFAKTSVALGEHETALVDMVCHLLGIAIERKAAQAQERLAAQVFSQSRDGITITDARANILLVNRAFSTITGYAESEVLGQNPRLMSSGRHGREFYAAMWDAVRTDGMWQGEIWNRRKNGEVYPQWLTINRMNGVHGEVTHYVAIFTDISQKKSDEERIKWMAHFDPLTGLPNRALLTDRFSHALSMSQRTFEPLALMFVDLDHFKNINDSLGHRVGDELLIGLARRMRQQVREQDTVARMGGDEFVLVLPGTDANGAAHLARKLLDSVAKPLTVGEQELVITPSIGIAIYPEDGTDFESLAQHADAAMYRAKQDGRNAYRFFAPEMQALSARTLLLEGALRRALERGQLSLHYQPQFDVRHGRIIGLEALLRWSHPELGAVSPAEFIPVAEKSGLILPIGEWVLRTAIEQLSSWIKGGLEPVVMAVNLSAVQFRHPNLPGKVSELLADAGLAPQHLELELTEGVATDDPLSAIAIMDDLHGRGVRMSIDDFGTGYSSLSYLKRFPVYKLKIDQSFVRDLTVDSEDKAIVSAIISMARSLGLQTIAEGVETAEQLVLLRAQGCDEVQGYHCSRPLPVLECERFMRARGSVETVA